MCTVRHETASFEHKCSDPCCVHKFPFKKEHLLFESEEEIMYDNGIRKLTKEEKEEKEQVIQNFINTANAEVNPDMDNALKLLNGKKSITNLRRYRFSALHIDSLK